MNRRDALFIQFIDNQGRLNVSSITCISSGGSAQTAFGILHAFYVSWLWHGCNRATLYASNIPNAVCASLPEDKQVMLETCRGSWFSINWMKSASRRFHYTELYRFLFFSAFPICPWNTALRWRSAWCIRGIELVRKPEGSEKNLSQFR
jgi:hypothetical protein